MMERKVGIILFGILTFVAMALLVSQLSGVQTFFAKYGSDVLRSPILAIMGGVLLWNLRISTEKRRDEKRYSDRQRRLLLALKAEISMQLRSYALQFEGETGEQRYKDLTKELETAKKGEHSMPIGVVPKENDVFDRVKDELADLPEDVIGPVIEYYQSDEYVAEVLKAFTNGQFEGKNIEKRKFALNRYFELGRGAAEEAREAIHVLEKELGGNK